MKLQRIRHTPSTDMIEPLPVDMEDIDEVDLGIELMSDHACVANAEDVTGWVIGDVVMLSRIVIQYPHGNSDYLTDQDASTLAENGILPWCSDN